MKQFSDSNRMKKFRYIVAALALLAVILVPSRVRQDLGWIDAVSGSRKTQTVWRFGLSSKPVIVESPLAARFKTLDLKWEPAWRNVQGTHRNIFGRSVGSEHGVAPVIYDLAWNPDLQRTFLAASSDDDVRAFFGLMTSGTEAEQKLAVREACDKALRPYASARPGE
ncbi:MAG: hypothetical protein ACREJC_20060 [Tepidisphaeraceae bacterium]